MKHDSCTCQLQCAAARAGDARRQQYVLRFGSWRGTTRQGGYRVSVPQPGRQSGSCLCTLACYLLSARALSPTCPVLCSPLSLTFRFVLYCEVGETTHKNDERLMPKPSACQQCHSPGQIRNAGGGSKQCLDWGPLMKGAARGGKLQLYWCHEQGGNQVQLLPVLYPLPSHYCPARDCCIACATRVSV